MLCTRQYEKKNFNQYEELLKNIKEPIFHHFLYEEIEVLEYLPFSLKYKTNSKRFSFLQVKSKLEELTGHTWHVSIIEEGNGSSLKVQHQNVFDEIYQEFIRLPNVDRILKTFPKAKVIFEREGIHGFKSTRYDEASKSDAKQNERYSRQT